MKFIVHPKEKVYKIKKGRKRSTVIPTFHYNLNWIEFTMKLSEGWWFPKLDQDSSDQSKLFGLGFGLNHHKNSIRLSCKPNFDHKGFVEVSGYSYDLIKERHTTTPIKDIPVKHEIKCGFYGLQTNDYLIVVDKTTVEIANSTLDKKLGLFLNPYFGGEETEKDIINSKAPCDLEVAIKIIGYG